MNTLALKPKQKLSAECVDRSSRSQVDAQEESEPPGQDDEPPQTGIAARRYFSHIGQPLWDDWKWQFKNRITTARELSRYLPLSEFEIQDLEKVTRRYPLSITPYYLSLIDPYDANDPVRRQAIPSTMEIDPSMQGLEDPLDENGDSVVPGLVHRYEDRALMVTTNICPVLCRHCTRKREWHQHGTVHTPVEFHAMIEYIRSHTRIRDVIVSGGDPLSLSTHRLEEIIAALRSIPHVEIIRIGSRFPVVLPQRIDAELCQMLSRYSPIWLNTHFNSVREITPESAAACDRLLKAGVPVNNQSVLLKGINDSVSDQLALCQGLLKIKVRPYYLFQCDEVQGVEHLRTPVEKGIEIIAGMRGRTSGLAIPSFVVDLPDGGGKVPLLPDYIVNHNEEHIFFRNYRGDFYSYRNPLPVSNVAESKCLHNSLADTPAQPERIGV
ncbi:MAG: KamA family radical SAM protein [Dehalococcoidaceae bacterium]|nr:KamA family radical SAM protein [Dehalococcoidaceae bacterium]